MALLDWLFFAVSMLPVLALAAAVLYAGYVAYETQRLREQNAARAPLPDPLVELTRVNAELETALAQGRQTLESTRATLQRGING